MQGHLALFHSLLLVGLVLRPCIGHAGADLGEWPQSLDASTNDTPILLQSFPGSGRPRIDEGFLQAKTSSAGARSLESGEQR